MILFLEKIHNAINNSQLYFGIMFFCIFLNYKLVIT
jgi:hypothetical protein